MLTTRDHLGLICSKIRDLNRVYGTCTDISIFAGMPDDEKDRLPIFSEGQVLLFEHSVLAGAFKTICGLPAARDGRKILAFVRAVKDAQSVGFSREWHRVNDDLEWMLVRYALHNIVTHGKDKAMQNVKAFVSECVADGADEHETVREFARAFSLAQNHMQSQLERLWLEMFRDHGISGAVDLFRERWKPVDDQTREAVNAAFVAAKNKFKNETK
jgi:hypothetical protein